MADVYGFTSKDAKRISETVLTVERRAFGFAPPAGRETILHQSPADGVIYVKNKTGETVRTGYLLKPDKYDENGWLEVVKPDEDSIPGALVALRNDAPADAVFPATTAAHEDVVIILESEPEDGDVTPGITTVGTTAGSFFGMAGNFGFVLLSAAPDKMMGGIPQGEQKRAFRAVRASAGGGGDSQICVLATASEGGPVLLKRAQVFEDGSYSASDNEDEFISGYILDRY